MGHSDSLGEREQRWLPKARVVKAFNTVGRDHMVHPEFPGGPPDMFICGNDAEAKKTVTGFLAAFGWNTIDIGAIEGARILEPLGPLWVTYAGRANSGTTRSSCCEGKATWRRTGLPRIKNGMRTTSKMTCERLPAISLLECNSLARSWCGRRWTFIVRHDCENA